MLACGAACVFVRIPGGLGAMGRVLALFLVGVIAAGIFLIGRHHARQRRERLKELPHAGDARES